MIGLVLHETCARFITGVGNMALKQNLLIDLLFDAIKLRLRNVLNRRVTINMLQEAIVSNITISITIYH